MSENFDLLDRWFCSKAWVGITEDADNGCPDAIELMEEISDNLCSLTFHLKNDSNDERIKYELKYFEQLCDDFEVA